MSGCRIGFVRLVLLGIVGTNPRLRDMHAEIDCRNNLNGAGDVADDVEKKSGVGTDNGTELRGEFCWLGFCFWGFSWLSRRFFALYPLITVCTFSYALWLL